MAETEMKGIRSPFQRGIYAQCDKKAKAAVKQWLMKQMIDDTERMGPDLSINKPPFKGYIEVEIKSWGWREDGTFEYDTVRIAERKNRYLEYGKVTFMILNPECTHAIVVDGKHLKDKYLEEVPNRRHRSGEYFFVIPMKHCKIVNLTTK